jgi:predicted nucleotidyltransferase
VFFTVLAENINQIDLYFYPKQVPGNRYFAYFYGMAPSLQLDQIKGTILQFLPGSSVLLFGSRARGEGAVSSDFDLLIITDSVMDHKAKLGYEKDIRKSLTHSFKKPFDIIVQTRKEWQEKKNLLGHIVYYATKEGVEI